MPSVSDLMVLPSLSFKSSTVPELVPCPGGASPRRASWDGPTCSLCTTFNSASLFTNSLIWTKAAG